MVHDDLEVFADVARHGDRAYTRKSLAGVTPLADFLDVRL
jgi:hypothetical protein